MTDKLTPEQSAADVPYVLRKCGMYYAHNSRGYVSRIELAELYGKTYAINHAEHSDEVTALPVTDVIKDVEHIDAVIERLEAIKEALEASDDTD